METSFNSSGSDPLLLLKERIIKTDTLLDKYSCLTRKFTDLEKAHADAVENEKKAKRDAIKYVEKYCKLVKKSNSLLIKIKTLEDNITAKANELKESQEEYAKLESVLQVYKTERKGHQCLKKDRDFLLTTLWKVLKRLEEEPKENKCKKVTETVYKRFERELMDLKLEDFRYNKVKSTSGLTEKEESEFLFSPASQVVDSVESDFIDTDLAPESVKSSFEFDENCGTERNKHISSNQKVVDTEHENSVKIAEEVNVLQHQELLLPDLSPEPFVSQDFEERTNSNLQQKSTSKDSAYVHNSENSSLNLSQNIGQESSSAIMTSFNFPTKGSSTSDIVTQENLQHQGVFQNCLIRTVKSFTQESKDNLQEEDKVHKQFKKTYCNKKLKVPRWNDEILKGKPLDRCQPTDLCSLLDETSTVLDSTTEIKSADIDVFDDSTETLRLETDVSVEDMGSIPHHIQYCERIYDFLSSSGETSHPKERTVNDEDPYMLFLTENELVNKPSEAGVDVEKTPVRKSPKIASLFDVEEGETFTSSGCVRDEEPTDICVEFSSDSGSVIDSRKDLNIVDVIVPDDISRKPEFEEEVHEKYQKISDPNLKEGDINDVTVDDNISRKPQYEEQVDEKCQKISDPNLKEGDISCSSNLILDSAITKNSPNLEFTRKENDISDEEVYKVLKDFKHVTLLSPIKEKEPSQKRQPFVSRKVERGNCNVNQVEKVKTSMNNTESREQTLRNKPDRGEGALSCDPKTDEGRDRKMVDKCVQIDDKVFLDVRETERQSSATNGETVFPEPVMRKLCKMVWKRNLKKFKHLSNFGSCLDVMKTILEAINRTRYFRNGITENYRFMEKNTGHSKSNLKCDERRMPSWQVEDVETTKVVSKNEPAFSYPKVEDCSFFTQVPIHYYSKDRFSNSAVKSEETRSQKNKMSLDWCTSERLMAFPIPARRKLELGDTCKFDASRESEHDSDVTFLGCLPNDVVKDSEKRCEDAANGRDTTDDQENTPESVSGNVSVTDDIRCDRDVGQTKDDRLEKCVEVKETVSRPGEVSEKTEKAAMLRRSPRIRSRNILLMEEKNRTSNHSVNLKKSRSSVKDCVPRVSLPSVNGPCTESRETSCNKSINDDVRTEQMSEETKSSRLKEKFEELFGEYEPMSQEQSDCGSTESEDPNTIFTPAEVQKQVPMDLETNSDGYTFGSATVSKKRRALCINSKSASTNNHKKIKLGVPCVREDKDLRRTSTENEVPPSDTYSLRDVTPGDNTNILDSIMTAMTKQTELFKVQTPVREVELSDADHRMAIRSPMHPAQPKDCIPFDAVHRKICNEYRVKGDSAALLNVPYYWNADNQIGTETLKKKKNCNSSGGNRREDAKIRALVEKEVGNFLKLDIQTVKQGEEKMKSVVKVLRNASENVIANTIVNEVMANVDEDLQEFERPAPPLTQTQHRIMIILTVFSTSEEQFHRIGCKILKLIRSKIFPENFFWPDDSLETATRFYAALCKKMNDIKGIWKFCFQVLTSMRQRWCIPILVVLQVWPDIIHDASKVENNILVKTFVNVILYTPKSEDMRRKRQEQKLLAIKHLLINFYNFDMNSTIEVFAQKLWESFIGNMHGSLDALVLISQCRNWTWTRKNVVAKLVESLESWMNGNSSDIIVIRVLDALQQIAAVFPDGSAAEASSAEDVISVLTRVLDCETLNPAAKEKVVGVLCCLCRYPKVREVLKRFSEKLSASEPLYADIIEALAAKNRKCKQVSKKTNTRRAWTQKKKTKAKNKGKKKKKNSSRQKGVLDVT